MAKLCARGKAAAKRKFKVYPSAYSNMYAAGVCSGRITPGGKKKTDGKPNGTASSVPTQIIRIEQAPLKITTDTSKKA